VPDPTLVQSTSGVSATASTVVTFPATAGANHLLVLLVGGDDYRVGDPSGWQLVSPGGEQQSFLGHNFWYKFSAGGETSATYVIGSASKSTYHFLEFDNIDTTTPFDISAGTFISSFGTTMTTPAIAPTTGRRLCIASIGGSGGTVSGLSGWTNSYVEALDSRTASPVVSEATAWQVLTGDGVTTTSTTATYDTSGPAARTAIIAAFRASTGASPVAVSATSALGGASSATARKMATVSARSAAGAAAGDTSRKVVVGASRSAVGLAGRATVRKVVVAVGRAAAGLAAAATGRKVAPAAGSSAAGLASRFTLAGAGSRPGAGSGAVGLSARASVARVGVASARSAAGLAGTAAGRKRATVASSATIGPVAAGSARKTAVAAARSTVALAARSTVGRRVSAVARSAIGLAAARVGITIIPKAPVVSAGTRSGPGVSPGRRHAGASGSPGTRPGPTISGGNP
jgi:hypothetical protein